MANTRVPILLVDDRQSNLLSLEAVLGRPEYELVGVTTGADALVELERREFAVVLLDLQMPTMDGIETASRMRERATQLGRQVPIIFVTAIDPDRERILRAYASGAVDFMLKPLEPAVLVAKVGVFADLYRARGLAREHSAALDAERRAGEEEARRFRLLIENVVDYAIFILDPKGCVSTWNAGARRIKGYAASEIIGKHFSTFYPPEDISAGKCEHELEVASRVGRYEEEGWRLRKDGSRMWASVTITALRSRDGTLVGFAKITRDLTERRAAEEESRRFRHLVESVQDYAIFILDVKGRVETWNVGAMRIKGYAATEIIGKHFSAFYPSDDVAAGKCERALETATRDGRFEEEGWRVRKDGSRFWASVTITALHAPDGALVGFAKVTRDLTERKRNEERLRRLAAENAALEARAAAEKIRRIQHDFLARAGETLASSLDYRTTLASVARLAVPELADWCSVHLAEPGADRPVQVAVEHEDPRKVHFAKELAERYPPDPNAASGVPEVIRTGKPLLHTEVPSALLERAARDGEHLRLLRELQIESAMVVPLLGRERVLGAVTFVYAGSGRRYSEDDLAFVADFARLAAMTIENGQAHAQLNETLDFQERFVAVLGHDLRNPLSSIDMAGFVLRQRALDAHDAATVQVLDRMRSSSRRMSRMIEQILDLTRSRLGGGLEVRPVSMDVSETLSSIVDELRAAHPSRNLKLQCASSLPGIWDRDRLEQVFSNLIANAIHYGAETKPVTVEARLLDGGGVQVTVHNEGEPIPEALQAQLFNPFRRGSRDSTASKTAGLGLGLYISRELARAHGGELDLRSNAAEGTSFRVTLPRTGSAAATHRGRVTAAYQERTTHDAHSARARG